MKVLRISLRKVTKRDVLAGSQFGRKVLGDLLEQVVDESKESQLVFLDFKGVEIATASFLRECVFEFRDVIRRRWSNSYPVVANANESIVEELTLLLGSRNSVLILCELDANDQTQSSHILGYLEAKQQIAFDLVKRLKEAEAAELMEACVTDKVSQSAWNNRLAALSKLGLLIESSRGRTKRYNPLPLLGD